MDNAQLAAMIVGSGGGGAVVLAAVNGLIRRLNGSSEREKRRNADLKSQRDDMYQRLLDAQRAADVETRRRRLTQEHAAELRSMLLERGTPQDTLPPWPTVHMSPYPFQDD